MINFLFKRTKEDEINIETIIKQETLTEVINKAHNETVKDFRNNLSKNIKDELFKKYNINVDYLMGIPIAYYKESLLIDAIINEMITTLELDK